MIAQVAKEHSKNAKVLLVHDWETSVWSSCTIHRLINATLFSLHHSKYSEGSPRI